MKIWRCFRLWDYIHKRPSRRNPSRKVFLRKIQNIRIWEKNLNGPDPVIKLKGISRRKRSPRSDLRTLKNRTYSETGSAIHTKGKGNFKRRIFERIFYPPKTRGDGRSHCRLARPGKMEFRIFPGKSGGGRGANL